MMNKMSRLLRRRQGAICERRGSILVLTAALMVVILVFAAFSVDLGYISMVKSQLQNASDSAAIAVLRELQDTSLAPAAREADALASAVQFAENNQPEYGDLLQNADITLGKWDVASGTFTAATWDPTAVQLTVRRATQNANKLDLFIAPAVGYDSIDVSVTSIAYIASVDVVPVALRSPSFGTIDPNVPAGNPGYEGSSSPLDGLSFKTGEEVVLFRFSQNVGSPVHLTLAVDKPGPGASQSDMKKVLRGDEDAISVADGDEYPVFDEGTGGESFGTELQKRLLEPFGSSKRTVKVPVVDALAGSRNSNNELVGPVRVSAFVSVHLDSVIGMTVPDPNDPGNTIDIQVLVGTVLENQADTVESLKNPNGRIRLVQ